MPAFRRVLYGHNFRLLICFIGFHTISALHIRGTVSSRANINCKEVLTKNLECPSIGSFPVAGECDYFARCLQTDNGVEAEVDFCPDGQIYVVNRCIKSRKNDCPQKSCARTQPQPVIIPTITEQTTIKTVFPPPAEEEMYPTTSKSRPTTKRYLPNLHPSRNEATGVALVKRFYLLLLSVLLINSTLFKYDI